MKRNIGGKCLEKRPYFSSKSQEKYPQTTSVCVGWLPTRREPDVLQCHHFIQRGHQLPEAMFVITANIAGGGGENREGTREEVREERGGGRTLRHQAVEVNSAFCHSVTGPVRRVSVCRHEGNS